MLKNRLSDSNSPYLLQHANNPVAWQIWSPEILQLAKDENKPLFISIGYSTCHWCHVMARESFESEEIAEIINENFIPIKIDREEMPDIDAHFMNYCRVIGQSCGWPLTVFAMPNGKPFFIATYLPPKSRHGYIGFKDLLNRIEALWKNAPDRIFVMAQEAGMQTQLANEMSKKQEMIDPKIFDKLNAHYTQSFDSINGGFSEAPKFPTPFLYEYLFTQFYKHGDESILEKALFSLKKISMGGIRDHIGGGFHRYSTDEKWLLPHFEKMLYDQAGMLIAYSFAFQITKDQIFKDTAYSIISYLKDNLLSHEGAFYSAEDADQEHEEGKLYLWDYNEIVSSSEFGKQIADIFNIKPNVNFTDPHNADNEPKNILFLSENLDESLSKFNITKQDFDYAILKIKDIRDRRIKPFKDEKILCDWNGFAIASLAIAGRIFGDSSAIELAKNAAEFIYSRAFSDGKLLHSYYNGMFRIKASLDDYAYLAYGLIELFKATHDFEYLNKAEKLIESAIEKFQDKELGIFYLNEKNETLKTRVKEVYDAAYPTGISIIFGVLVEAWIHSGKDLYRNSAEFLLKSISGEINKFPAGFATILTKYDLLKNGGNQVIISANKDSTKEYIEFINGEYLPDLRTVLLEPDKKYPERFEIYTQINNKATVYYCSNFTCSSPITSLEEFKKIFNK